MQADEALRIAAERASWSPAQIAAVTGRSESAARRWLSGETQMKASEFQTLRRDLPGFAELVDGKAVA